MCWWMAITCSSRTWHGTSTRITFVICVAHRLICVCDIVAVDCVKHAARDVHGVSTLRGTHVSVSRVQALLFWNTVSPTSFESEWAVS